MGADPEQSAWYANKSIDGNPSQDFKSNSCAITDVEGNRNTSIWWKVWLQQQFNVAYLEIYFRSDSEFTKNILIIVVKPLNQIHLFTFANILPYINLQSSDSVQFAMFTFANMFHYINLQNSEKVQFCKKNFKMSQ